MSLKLRRGTNTQRTSITPAEGELIYVTDTKKLYVGDGITAGGIAVDTNGSGAIDLNGLTDVILTTPSNGEVLKYNGSEWVNTSDTGITDIVQDASPQLGGSLDVNGKSIVSTSNGNIIISPDGSGSILLNSGDVVIGSQDKSGKLTIVNSDNAINSFQFFYCGSNITDPLDGANFVFRRSRGTFNSPTIVQQNDDIVDIFFQAFDGTAYRTMAKIGAQIDGLVSNNLVPGSMTFSVHDSTTPGVPGLNEILSLTNDGFTKTNKISSKTTNANLELTANGTGKITLNNLSWPSSDGTNGQVLTTNGAGSLSWTTISSGGSTFSRTTVVGSSSSLADGSSENVDITGASKGYLLYKIQTNEPARVRIYTDQASRTADESRAEGVPSTAGNGLIAEIITTTSNQVYILSPGVIGFNNESTPTTSIFLRVTNKGGYTTPINTTLTILNLET